MLLWYFASLEWIKKQKSKFGLIQFFMNEAALMDAVYSWTSNQPKWNAFNLNLITTVGGSAHTHASAQLKPFLHHQIKMNWVEWLLWVTMLLIVPFANFSKQSQTCFMWKWQSSWKNSFVVHKQLSQLGWQQPNKEKTIPLLPLPAQFCRITCAVQDWKKWHSNEWQPLKTLELFKRQRLITDTSSCFFGHARLWAGAVFVQIANLVALLKCCHWSQCNCFIWCFPVPWVTSSFRHWLVAAVATETSYPTSHLFVFNWKGRTW